MPDKANDIRGQLEAEQKRAKREIKSELRDRALEQREAKYGGGYERFDGKVRELQRRQGRRMEGPKLGRSL